MLHGKVSAFFLFVFFFAFSVDIRNDADDKVYTSPGFGVVCGATEKQNEKFLKQKSGKPTEKCVTIALHDSRAPQNEIAIFRAESRSRKNINKEIERFHLLLIGAGCQRARTQMPVDDIEREGGPPFPPIYRP